MPIRIVCPGCRKRFQVSDKFAGKKGPCPSCKTEIRIPAKSEEVVVHEPENFGPKTTEGKAVLKPIFREETRFTPLLAGAIGLGVLVVLGLALIFRMWFADEPENFPTIVLALGAILLAPPLVFSGYTFLRDDELQPYRGTELYLRVAICAAVFALLWGVYAFIEVQLFPDKGYEFLHLCFVLPLLIAAGGSTAHLSLDIEFGNGVLHYCFYLGISVILRLIMGLPAF